jgi:hypothetical protein
MFFSCTVVSINNSQDNGRPSKPIRLMVGLLLLKQLENLSDERVVLQFKRNPYYQYFCGYSNYMLWGNVSFSIGGVGDVFLLYGGVNQYARLLGLFAMQGMECQ